MDRRFILIVFMPLLFGAAGCRSAQLQYDQDQFRHRLMQMYTDQIMDNLIRCHEGMPFVQLDYSKITGTITQQENGNVGGNQGATNIRGDLFTAFKGATHQFLNAFTWGAGASQINQLTVTADPVIDDPTIYQAYLNFLGKKDRLLVTCDCPPPGAALIERTKGNVHYWVPVQYRDDFRELSLTTIAMRGEAVEAPEFFEVTISGVAEKTAPEPIGGEYYSYDLELLSADEVLGIPSKGKKLIIVAPVGNLLHFRIFDADGKMVVDTEEKSLTDQAQKVVDLKGMLPPHKLTKSEEESVVAVVNSMFGRWTRYEVKFAIKPSIVKDSGVIKAASVNGRLCTFRFDPDVSKAKTKPSTTKKEQSGLDDEKADSEKSTDKDEEKMDTIILDFIADTRPPDVLKKAKASGHFPFSVDTLIKELSRQTVKIKLDSHRPSLQSTPDLLKSIDHQMELFRLNQQRAL